MIGENFQNLNMPLTWYQSMLKRKIKRELLLLERGCNKMWTWKSAHVQRKVPIKSGLYGPENIYGQSWWNNFVIYDSLAELLFSPTNYCKIPHFHEIWEIKTLCVTEINFLEYPIPATRHKKRQRPDLRNPAWYHNCQKW